MPFFASIVDIVLIGVINFQYSKRMYYCVIFLWCLGPP